MTVYLVNGTFSFFIFLCRTECSCPVQNLKLIVMQDEWRIQMLPIKFLFLAVWPVIDMRLRCKSTGRDYPPQIPQDVSKVLELDIVRIKV